MFAEHFPYTDVFTADDFRNIMAKGAISPFAIMFSTLFNNLTYILKIFHIFVEMLSKSFASELLYVGKG